MAEKRATLSLIEGLQFRVRTSTGHEMLLDSSPDGPGVAGPSPMELQLVALASCTSMDVISILRKMREDVLAYDVEAVGRQQREHPRKFTGAEIVHRVRGRALNEDKVRRAIQVTITRYCPVYAMLAPGMEIVERYVLFDEQGAQIATGTVEPEPLA